MDSIFSYDSKLVQMFIRLADLMLLNMLFLICCIPLVTIGAAQTALHSAINQMQNRENDESVYKAFFKGLVTGFGKITLVHTLGLLVILLLVWISGSAYIYADHLGGTYLPVWAGGIGAFLLTMFHSMITPFFARFDCTARQLVKNAYLMTLAHPLRAFANALLTWIPFLVAIVDFYTFLQIFPIWILLYYSIAFLFCHSIMKKPFRGLIEDFEAAQQEKGDEATEDAPEEIEDTEEDTEEE